MLPRGGRLCSAAELGARFGGDLEGTRRGERLKFRWFWCLKALETSYFDSHES